MAISISAMEIVEVHIINSSYYQHLLVKYCNLSTEQICFKVSRAQQFGVK